MLTESLTLTGGVEILSGVWLKIKIWQTCWKKWWNYKKAENWNTSCCSMISREKLPDKSHSLLLESSFEKAVRKSSPKVFLPSLVHFRRDSDCATTQSISNISVAPVKAVFPVGSKGGATSTKSPP